MEQLVNESDAAYKIRRRMVEEYDCTFQANHKAYFFEHPHISPEHEETHRIVRFLDSVYAALQAPEEKVALRAYIQACEYSFETRYRFLRLHYETAYYEAKNRIEKFLEG